MDSDDRIVDDYPIPAGALLHYKDGEMAEEEALLAQWDPYNIPILLKRKEQSHSRTCFLASRPKLKRCFGEGPWS